VREEEEEEEEEEDNNNNDSNMKGFSPKGFQIYNLNDDINESDMITLNEKAEKCKTNPIFNQDINPDIQTKDFRNDKKRSISIPINKNLPVFKRMIRGINQIAELINNDNYTVQSGYVLRSLEGCAAQAVHTDGNVDKRDFFSCVFAIQEGTKININGRVVNIPKGEALFFHSKVKHNGCSYSTKNNRYFFYIAKTIADIPTDEVGDIEPIYCKHCNIHICNKSDYRDDRDDVNKMNKKISNHKHKYCRVLNDPPKLEQIRQKNVISNQKSRRKKKEE
jgi:hypothetical protein